MSQYKILITEETKHDILQLADVIKYQYKLHSTYTSHNAIFNNIRYIIQKLASDKNRIGSKGFK